jgi:hypothetical protein
VSRFIDQPSVIDNNQREIFNRLPGIVLGQAGKTLAYAPNYVLKGASRCVTITVIK